ncbi:MAG: phosphate signaling complex protein PhoU [Nitrospirae bacterium]|nr:phosphate signaling complex protein PhoU [Nitrospirota bacterium]
MSYYEERMEQDLSTLRNRVSAVAARIQEALRNSVHATLTGDRVLANRVILGDLAINREIRDIDRICHAFVARHLPSAGHLRFVSSVLRLNVELERVGDYGVAIAREMLQLSTPPSGSIASDIQLIANQAGRVLEEAIHAFNEGNPDLARGAKAMAPQVDATFRKIFEDLLLEGESKARPIKDLFALLVILNRLGRVSDQAKNICEDTIFAATGETKAEKVYRILFIDGKNSSLSQLAEAYARKAFPDSGEYTSAGWRPASQVDPTLEVFLEKNRLDGAERRPKPLDLTVDELGRYHVIVSLEGDARPHLPAVPFHTLLLDWDVGAIPEGLDTERTTALLEESYKNLTFEIRELMEALRGGGAS